MHKYEVIIYWSTEDAPYVTEVPELAGCMAHGASHETALESWRKLKGIGRVELLNGCVHLAELHWYEAHGVGRRMMKVKRLLD